MYKSKITETNDVADMANRLLDEKKYMQNNTAIMRAQYGHKRYDAMLKAIDNTIDSLRIVHSIKESMGSHG